MKDAFTNLKYDLPASIVVFLVAIPLCLGVALASGTPLFSGIIAGVIGGIVVGIASGSTLGVSGPAAGLITIVLGYLTALDGSWHTLLLAISISGVIQIIAGFLRLGTIAYYFPSSVIKGMLSGIGLIIILKQIPHALGYIDGLVSPAAALIFIVSLPLMIFWENFLSKKHRIFRVIPAPLVAVLIGIFFFQVFEKGLLPFTLSAEQMVRIPVASGLSEFLLQFNFPDFSQITNPKIYYMALVIALVTSIETLLCVEATDKLDPQKRITPTNRELKAQGLGNLISGLIGGLPITQVVVRSSANIAFGGRTKMSTILHGFLLLVSAITIPKLLNMIPLSSLACVLLMVGYKLAKPQIFKHMYKLGSEQFVPFILTIIAMILTDLLKGVGVGMIAAIIYLLYNNFCNAYHQIEGKGGKGNKYIIKLAEEVSFLNKGSILRMLKAIPENSEVLIDGRKSSSIHYDVIEMLHDFKTTAKTKNISLEIKGINFRKN